MTSNVLDFRMVVAGADEKEFVFRLSYRREENLDAIRALRAQIPESDRRFDGECWHIDSRHWGKLTRIFDNFAELYDSARRSCRLRLREEAHRSCNS